MTNRNYFIFLSALTLISIFLPLLTYSEAYAEKGISARDRLRLLYSSRISFDKNGVPELGLGLFQGKDSITFKSSSVVSVTMYAKNTASISIAPESLFSVKIKNAVSGTTSIHLVLESITNDKKSELKQRLSYWKQEGFAVKPLRLGSVVSLKGNVIDNTKYHVAIGPFDNKNQAEKAKKAIQKKYNTLPFILEQMTRLPKGTIDLIGPDGEAMATSNDLILLRIDKNSRISIVEAQPSIRSKTPKNPDRIFDSVLYVTIDKHGKLAVGTWMSFEQLLRGTIPAEIFTSSPLEALKAQTIAARGHILSKLGTRHLSDPFHICTKQHCQVYSGPTAYHANTDKAVLETTGEFLVNSKKLVDTVYSSSCGGHTENNDAVWPQPVDSHLRGILDVGHDNRFSNGITESNLNDFLYSPPEAYCSKAGYNYDKYRWDKTFSVAEITRLVNAKYKTGEIVDIIPIRRGVSGRIIELKITGKLSSAVITRELPIRRLLGGLPSALFIVRNSLDADGKLRQITLRGAGFGHGVGLCQTGAIGRAKIGQTYDQILKAYYGKNSKILRLY